MLTSCNYLFEIFLHLQYLGSPCYLGLGRLLNTPVAIVVSGLETFYVDNFMGNPSNFAIFPGTSLEKVVLNTFFDRVWNLILNYKDALTFYHYTSDQTNLMRKYLGWDLPDVRQLERNVTLALVNTHHSIHGIRSFAPAMVEVGGLHIQDEETPLPPVSPCKTFVGNQFCFHPLVCWTN